MDLIALESNNFDELKALIEDLISNNFEGLIQLLYRIDVQEDAIVTISKNKAIDAADLTQLIFERLQTKKEQRAYWSNYFNRDNRLS